MGVWPRGPEEPMTGIAGCLSAVKNNLQINVGGDTEMRRDKPTKGQVTKLWNFLMGRFWGESSDHAIRSPSKDSAVSYLGGGETLLY